jgi:subtilisin-like proprotein convertase family protein
MNSQNIEYELINKENFGVLPVSDMIMGGEVITVRTKIEDQTEVKFENIEKKGNLFNEKYAIRQVKTKLTANADKIVNDLGIEIDITEAQRQDIQAGLLSPDEITL